MRKLSAVCCLGVLSFVLVGCADSAATVDKVADTPIEAVETTTDAASTPAEGAVDHAETTKDGTESTTEGK